MQLSSITLPDLPPNAPEKAGDLVWLEVWYWISRIRGYGYGTRPLATDFK